MKFYIVDCFAKNKYQGNQLLVVIADRKISDEEQQKIAKEINFSETTFILSDKKENGGYDVRIWTPNVGEIPFAGHPTLGTAYVIYKILEKGKFDTIKLNLKVGQIPVIITDDLLTMKQNPPKFGKIIQRKEIAKIFNLDIKNIRDDFPIQCVSTGLEAVLIPLSDREALKKLKMNKKPFLEYIKNYPECNCNHLFFVDMGNRTFSARCMMEDFIEDPATGSANGNLAAYLIKYSYFKSQDISYTVYQGEDMKRLSILNIRAFKIDENWYIEVGGKCHIIASGNWR